MSLHWSLFDVQIFIMAHWWQGQFSCEKRRTSFKERFMHLLLWRKTWLNYLFNSESAEDVFRLALIYQITDISMHMACWWSFLSFWEIYFLAAINRSFYVFVENQINLIEVWLYVLMWSYSVIRDNKIFHMQGISQVLVLHTIILFSVLFIKKLKLKIEWILIQ